MFFTSSAVPGRAAAVRHPRDDYVRHAPEQYRPFSDETLHFYSEQSMVGRIMPKWARGMTPVETPDPYKLDAVARMGGNWYARAQGDSLFEVPKPGREVGMGFDNLPEQLLRSDLTGNELAKLAGSANRPSKWYEKEVENPEVIGQLKELLKEDKIEEAWNLIEKWLKK